MGVAIWWEEETITDTDIKNAWSNLLPRDFKVDFVLSHCPPESFIHKANLYPNPIISNSEKQLETVLEIVDFKHWYCGHVHKSADVEVGGKKISSLKIDEFMRI